jgi:hypothetical protein
VHAGSPAIVPDAFYTSPTDLPAKPGQLLCSQPLTIGGTPGAQAWILYTATMADGVPAVAIGTVLGPTKRTWLRHVGSPGLLDHPDDPTGPFAIRLDRRGLQREQARSVWSRPDRRTAPGYGSGGWGFESLAARQTPSSVAIKQEKLDGPVLAVSVLDCY